MAKPVAGRRSRKVIRHLRVVLVDDLGLFFQQVGGVLGDDGDGGEQEWGTGEGTRWSGSRAQGTSKKQKKTCVSRTLTMLPERFRRPPAPDSISKPCWPRVPVSVGSRRSKDRGFGVRLPSALMSERGRRVAVREPRRFPGLWAPHAPLNIL